MPACRQYSSGGIGLSMGLAALRVLAQLLLIFHTVAVIAGPSANLKLSEYQKQEWQVEDGLPENNVRMIAQRPDGSLLLATSSGISSFDGLHFRALSVHDGTGFADGMGDNEAVNAVLPSGNEDLWIGTDGHGVLHQTASGTVNISERAGFLNERIRNIYMDSQGVLWIATQNGVERFCHDRLEVIPGTGMISGAITSVFAEDGHGGMFYVTSSGLFHWRDGVARSFRLQLPKWDAAVAVYRDPQQRIWVGTMQHMLQLQRTDPPTRSRDDGLQFKPVVTATLASPVNVLRGDAAGNLWIGTRSDGLWRLSAEGVARWNSHDGLADDVVESLFVDDEQNLWIGMLSGGLSRWRKGSLAPYGDPEGFHASYSANVLADSRGDLWLGTWGSGLFRRHNGRLIPTNPPDLPVTVAIRALAEDHKGQIWVGTWFEGVYRYDGKGFRHYLLGNESPGNAVSAILPDRQGGLWVGTYIGLVYYPSGEPNRLRRSMLLASNLITCLLEDSDGSILVGTSTGLYRVRNGNPAVVSDLAHTHILSLTRDSGGYVWVSTKGSGLAAVRGDRAAFIPPAAGLPNAYVNTAVEDNDGHLWFGTSHGIVRVSRDELQAVVDGRRPSLSSVILDRADGMRSSECGGPSKPSSARLPDGTLWFVTTKGFVHTTDVAEALGSARPVAAITGWALSTDPNTEETAHEIAPSRIELEAGHTDILFFFNAKQLANPAHIEFRYRLSEYETAWTNTRTRVAHYKRLPPGKYRFEVQARGSGEEWSSPVASIPLQQDPYIYQTWYFYFALALVTAALVVQIFRRRVQLLKGRIGIVVEERNRIARECHDTLMAGFAAVSWQLEATAKLFRDSKSESTPPAESCELARSMVAHCQAEARRIIWDLRDTDEVTNILSHALARTLSANLTPVAIETTFDVDGEELPLAPGCVHHLVCIGQEAVSNAIRHAQPSNIAIRLKYESDGLTLSIRDDGRGFQNADSSMSGHFGIPVMEERARKLGGALRLLSSPGGGTEVTVKVSFNALQQPASQEHHVIRWIGI